MPYGNYEKNLIRMFSSLDVSNQKVVFFLNVVISKRPFFSSVTRAIFFTAISNDFYIKLMKICDM